MQLCTSALTPPVHNTPIQWIIETTREEVRRVGKRTVRMGSTPRLRDLRARVLKALAGDAHSLGRDADSSAPITKDGEYDKC